MLVDGSLHGGGALSSREQLMHEAKAKVSPKPLLVSALCPIVCCMYPIYPEAEAVR
jgi:hypothetical protein